jgi:leader peptidase (prepilin peptidase)/N-methyltransferase
MSASLLLVVLVGVLGVAVGSFLNVVVYRVPRRESIAFPGSHCPSCETPIKPRHNVPIVSWLALRGHCAYCSAPISVRYPLIEAATGLLCAGIAAGWWPCAVAAAVAVTWLTAVLALRRADNTGTQFVSITTTGTTQPLEGAVPWPR